MNELIRFGAVTLPEYDFQTDVGTGPSTVAMTALVGGGAFDGQGGDDAPLRLPYTVRYNGTVTDPSAETVRSRIDELRALRGKRLKLWRRCIDDGRTQWALARLLEMKVTSDVRSSHWRVPVELTFSILSRWNGSQHDGGWKLDTGKKLDDGLTLDGNELTVLTSSPQTITVDNDGNVAVRDAVVMITAGSTAITYLKVGISGVCEWEYAGSISAGQALVVDCGAKSVLNNGANAYSGFELTANHTVADWLVLEPGNNSVVVTRTGGGSTSTVEFVFSDGWA